MLEMHDQNAEDARRSAALPIGLFFVSVFAAARALLEAQAGPGRHFLVRLLGPFPMLLLLVGMSALGVIWFARGRVAWPLRKVLALLLVALPLAAFLGTLGSAPETFFWGGVAGRNISVVLEMLPAVMAAGVAGLLAIFSGIVAWRLAFQPPVIVPSTRSDALALALAPAAGTRISSRREHPGAVAPETVEDLEAPEIRPLFRPASDDVEVEEDPELDEEVEASEELEIEELEDEEDEAADEDIEDELEGSVIGAPSGLETGDPDVQQMAQPARPRRILDGITPDLDEDEPPLIGPAPLIALHRELDDESDALEARFAALEAEDRRSRPAPAWAPQQGRPESTSEVPEAKGFGERVWSETDEDEGEDMEETAVLGAEDTSTATLHRLDDEELPDHDDRAGLEDDEDDDTWEFHPAQVMLLQEDDDEEEEDETAERMAAAALAGTVAGGHAAPAREDLEEDEDEEDAVEAEAETAWDLDEADAEEDEDVEDEEEAPEEDLEEEDFQGASEDQDEDEFAEEEEADEDDVRQPSLPLGVGFFEPSPVRRPRAAGAASSEAAEALPSPAAAAETISTARRRGIDSGSGRRAPRRPAAPAAAADPSPAPAAADPDEDLYRRAVALVSAEESCSAAMLQRKFSITFTEASAILDRMHDDDIVGPPLPSGRREILAPGGMRENADTAGT